MYITQQAEKLIDKTVKKILNGELMPVSNDMNPFRSLPEVVNRLHSTIDTSNEKDRKDHEYMLKALLLRKIVKYIWKDYEPVWNACINGNRYEEQWDEFVKASLYI